MSRRSHIAVIPEVAQTSVCVPVNHIVRDPFTKLPPLSYIAAAQALSLRSKQPGFFPRSICERRATYVAALL
jgi:hypothetical protein